MSVDKVCRDCKETFQQYSTLQNRCFNCTRARYVQPKRKAIRKIGKVTEKWIDYRADWIERHGGKTGQWVCALRISPLCLGDLTIDTLTLDHRIPRSGAPKLRYNDDNIQPACGACNGQKGSRRI